MPNFWRNINSDLLEIYQFLKKNNPIGKKQGKPKRLIGILLIIGFFTFIIYNIYNDNRKYKLFHAGKINSKIVKKKWHWSGRSYRYVTEENVPITLSNDKLLLIGDSVSKRNNTDSFKAFRLNSLDSIYYLVELNK